MESIIKAIIAIVLILCAFMLVCAGAYESIKDFGKKENKVLESYQNFQKNTEVINGVVKKSQKESKFIFPDSFNIIVETTEGSKMLKVNEQQYRDYQPKNRVHFRIDKTDNNKVVRDLNNENDLDSLKKYEKYYKDSPARLFSAN